MAKQIKMQPLLQIVIDRVDTDLFEGKICELDLVICGDSVDEVCSEISHALIVYFNAALKIGKTPFLDLVRSTHNETVTWDEDEPCENRILSIPDSIMAALSIALGHKNVTSSVELRYNKAA